MVCECEFVNDGEFVCMVCVCVNDGKSVCMGGGVCV